MITENVIGVPIAPEMAENLAHKGTEKAEHARGMNNVENLHPAIPEPHKPINDRVLCIQLESAFRNPNPMQKHHLL